TSSHDLLVASGNDNRIQRFNGTNGQFISAFTVAGGLGQPIGFNYGPDANLYVTSFGTHKVARYDSVSGAYLGDFVTNSSGGLSGPNFMEFRPPVRPAPTLNAAASGSNAAIAWPEKDIPAVLEKSTSLVNPAWQMVTNAISADGSTNTITL